MPWDPDGKAMVEALRSKHVPPINDRTGATVFCEEGAARLPPAAASPDIDAAFASFRSALERDPTFPAAYAGIARIFMLVGAREKEETEPAAAETAYEWAERGLAYESSNYECVHAKAEALSALDRGDDAMSLASYLLNFHGQRYETYRLLARVARKKGMQNEAMNYAYQALVIAGDGALRTEAELGLANTYFEYEQWSRAFDIYERYLVLSPADARALHHASICCARTKDYEKALEYSRRAQGVASLEEARDVEKEVLRILAARDEKLRRSTLKPKP